MKIYIKAEHISRNLDFDYRPLKDYKGYEIWKAWYVDSEGKRISKYPVFYLVADAEDLVGEEYETLSEAKQYVDSIS